MPDPIQERTFKAKDAQGNMHTVNCTRRLNKKTQDWDLWECFTSKGQQVTSVDEAKGEFMIIDPAQTRIMSLKPNPLK